MPFPEPYAGLVLVIRYCYLWKRGHEAGREERSNEGSAVHRRSARKMGYYLITETMSRRHELSMESYDRPFSVGA